jgi:Amidohydrolase family
MKKLLYTALILLLVASATIVSMIVIPMDESPLVGVNGSYAISRVNVINTFDGSIASDMVVFTEHDKILDVLPYEKYIQKPGFVEISAAGKYIIPGLWDMHSHSLKISPQIHHPLLIRNGVTAVRDLSGCLNKPDNYWACPEDRRNWTQQAETGSRVSPRYILQSSYQTNGGNEVPGGFPEFFKLSKRDDSRKLIEFYSSDNVDFVKTYTELTLEQYDNLVHFASQSNIHIAGHKPISVSLQHAIKSGQKSIEHGRLFLFECFEGIEAFRRLHNPIKHYNAQFMRELISQRDEKKCHQLMQAMAQSETWWVPTLTTLKMGAFADDGTFRNDKRLEYIPYVVKNLIWFPDANNAAKTGGSDDNGHIRKDFFARAKEDVNRANHYGIKILAGTDNTDTYVFSGSSLHDELNMMVEAGLSPLEALQSATLNPAVFAGLEFEFGSVDKGKRADLLLLNSNPLDDIKNIRDINAVIFNGYHFDQNALNQLSLFAKSMAKNIQVNIRFLWDALSSPLMRVQLAD